jgi:antirestriction protein ArdC
MRDIYQDVTDRIVAELERGAAPWVKPWSGQQLQGGAMPYNAATGKRYRGVNIPLLMAVSSAYGRSGFVTFKQALDLGGHVRKGERGHQVVFWKFLKASSDKSADAAEDAGEEKLIPFARAYTVFNVAQCDGLQLPATSTPAPINAGQRSVELDSAIARLGASIAHDGGDAAFYRPATDSVHLPAFERFRDASNYYATVFHELAHWTGSERRLARQLANRFGSSAYAAEELVAELGAAFLCAEHGVAGELRHAGYLDSWLKVLRQDKRAIFTAASKAQQAADFINTGMAAPALALAA